MSMSSILVYSSTQAACGFFFCRVLPLIPLSWVKSVSYVCRFCLFSNIPQQGLAKVFKSNQFLAHQNAMFSIRRWGAVRCPVQQGSVLWVLRRLLFSQRRRSEQKSGQNAGNSSTQMILPTRSGNGHKVQCKECDHQNCKHDGDYQSLHAND